jgi:hypothetical protein
VQRLFPRLIFPRLIFPRLIFPRLIFPRLIFPRPTVRKRPVRKRPVRKRPVRKRPVRKRPVRKNKPRKKLHEGFARPQAEQKSWSKQFLMVPQEPLKTTINSLLRVYLVYAEYYTMILMCNFWQTIFVIVYNQEWSNLDHLYYFLILQLHY